MDFNKKWSDLLFTETLHRFLQCLGVFSWIEVLRWLQGTVVFDLGTNINTWMSNIISPGITAFAYVNVLSLSNAFKSRTFQLCYNLFDTQRWSLFLLFFSWFWIAIRSRNLVVLSRLLFRFLFGWLFFRFALRRFLRAWLFILMEKNALNIDTEVQW